MLISYCGVPGSGKTLHSVGDDALKKYKKDNSSFKKFIYWLGYKLKIKSATNNFLYYKCFPKNKINSIYSNFPILLDKKNKIYSNKVSLFDLEGQYSFLPNSLIIIDEVQLYIDSDDYKDKDLNLRIRRIGKFLQSHRHFGIDRIIFVSQHPSRIFKKGRNICESYSKHYKIFKLPFGLTFIKTIIYFDLDSYGKFIPKDRKLRKMLDFDFKKKLIIFNRKKAYKSYHSRYLCEYNYNKPLLDLGTYDNLSISYDEVAKIFEDNIF